MRRRFTIFVGCCPSPNSRIDAEPGETWTATADARGTTPAWFAGGSIFPAGTYRITYLGGGHILLPESSLYTAEAIAVVTNNQGVVLSEAPYPEPQPTVAELTALASEVEPIEFTHTGGRLGLYCFDFEIGDNNNSNGTPPASWVLERL